MTASRQRLFYCRDVFELFCEAFDRMEQESGGECETVEIRFAGHRLRLRILGRELARAMRAAFTPWNGDAAPVSLEINLWDESPDTGIDPRIRLECGLDEEHLRMSIITGLSASGRYVCNMADAWLNFLDLDAGRIVGCVLSRDGLHVHERARPLELPLRFWLRSKGLPVLHAGLVALDDRGVLIGGPAGAGKSTTALGCVDQGWDYVADDKVGLEVGHTGTPVGRRLYPSMLVSADVLPRFQRVRRHALVDPASGKAIVIVSQLFPDRILDACPIRAIVLPRVGEGLGRPRLRPARRSQAIHRMLANCLPLYPNWDRSDFERLRDLVETSPVFWLDLGGDATEISALMKQALRGA